MCCGSPPRPLNTLPKNNRGYTIFQLQIQHSPHIQFRLHSGTFVLQTLPVFDAGKTTLQTKKKGGEKIKKYTEYTM